MNATPAKTALPAYHQVDYKGHVIYYVNGEYRADGNEFKDMNAAKAHIVPSIADVKAFREQKARSDSTTSAFILAIRC